MNSVSEELKQLQLKIVELEKQQKEEDERAKKLSIDYNFNVIKDVLTNKKTKIYSNYYTSSQVSHKSYDTQLVTHLEAIYNILHILDKRLEKLEQK
jgi:hypothetical protein